MLEIKFHKIDVECYDLFSETIVPLQIVFFIHLSRFYPQIVYMLSLNDA